MSKSRRVLLLVLLLSSTAVLVGDACRHLPWLHQLASESDDPAVPLFLAARQSDVDGLNALSDYAKQQQDLHWLRLSGALGASESLYTLGLLEQEPAEQKRYFQRAAKLEHAPSQYELFLASESNNSQHYWLQKAAEGGFAPAMLAMYQWYQMQNEQPKARNWLERNASFDGDSALILARSLWREGDVDAAKTMFDQAAELGTFEALNYVHHLDTFWRKSAHQLRSQSAYQVRRSGCTIQLQFVATSLESMVQATQFQEAFVNDDRLRRLPICIETPVWVEGMQCDENWQGQGRLGCDLAPLVAPVKTSGATHAVVFAQVGKANVHNGVMFLDQADTYAVFVHELAHFAGFADEYPLSTHLAQRICSDNNAPNLLVKPVDENLTFEDVKKWSDTDQDWEVSPSRTCNNHPLQAFKPVRKMTFMEYFDQEFIPEIYLTLWHSRLHEPHNLVPVFVNFAQYFGEHGDFQQAQFWREQHRAFIADSPVDEAHTAAN